MNWTSTKILLPNDATLGRGSAPRKVQHSRLAWGGRQAEAWPREGSALRLASAESERKS
jgi:hypothetical protein